MSTDRDLELGAALRALPTPEHGPDFWEGLEAQLDGEPAPSELDRRSGSGRRFAPRGMWLLSAAAVVAMVVAAVTLIDNDEGTRIRVTPATPEEATWTTLPDSPLGGRFGHVAVWTGERMLVWGGGGGGADGSGEPVNDGAAYDPATERWTPMAASPTGPLFGATGVWTGTRMLVWGMPFVGPGEAAEPTVETGAAYDPVADRWTPISRSPLRTVGGHTAVWTGERMLIWGGSVFESPVADGASYDPTTDRWTELPPSPLAARFDHEAVWTGDRMIVWGGFAGEESPSGITAFADGAAYDPATDSWAMLPAAPIVGRGSSVAVWTGGWMVVWGGSGAGEMTDGARYDPVTETWLVLPPSPLTARLFPTAVAAQGSMLVWGGQGAHGTLADGAAYDPATDAWTALPDSPIGPRNGHSTVWTGSAMLVWGGSEGQDYLADGAALRYGPKRTTGRTPTTAPPTTAGRPTTTTTAGPIAPPSTLAPGPDPGTPPIIPPTGGLATPNDAVTCVFRAFLANAPAQALPCSRSQADVDELFANFQPNGVTRGELAEWNLTKCESTSIAGLTRCTFEPPRPRAEAIQSFTWLTEQRGTEHFFAGFEYD